MQVTHETTEFCVGLSHLTGIPSSDTFYAVVQKTVVRKSSFACSIT